MHFTAAGVSALQINIGNEDASGVAHTAVVGNNLIVSCNDGSANWTGPGAEAIPEMSGTNTRVYTRVYTTVENTQTDLHLEPFQASDGGTYSCTRGSDMATVTLGRY